MFSTIQIDKPVANLNTSCLAVNGISVSLNNNLILSDISLALAKGDIGCFLGESGCGKTTLLRSIAGFIAPTQGEICINDEVMSSQTVLVPVEKRQVGMVFQDFALFPHLSVFDNIAFGLKQLKMSKAAINDRVAALLALVELSDKAERYPHELSGGQQQRIALARALAPKPSIILLDEPFSSIDKSMRDSLALKVRDILKQENATAIMVTHDQTEAFAMADYVGVIREGKLLQWDKPMNIYHSPSDEFVAGFIGESSFITAEVVAENKITTVFGSHELSNDLVNANNGINQDTIGQRKRLLVRPDDVILCNGENTQSITATIVHCFFKGASFMYLLRLPNDEKVLMLANMRTNQQYAVGDTIEVVAGFNQYHLY